MKRISPIAGWIGTVLIILAYYLNSHGQVKGTDAAYQFMNLFGALGVGITVFYKKAWPAVALNMLWFFIALHSLVR